MKATTKTIAAAFNRARNKAFDDADVEGVWHWQPSALEAFKLGWRAAEQNMARKIKTERVEVVREHSN